MKNNKAYMNTYIKLNFASEYIKKIRPYLSLLISLSVCSR